MACREATTRKAVTPSRSSPGAELSAISHSHLAPCAAFSSGVIPRNEGSRRQDVMIGETIRGLWLWPLKTPTVWASNVRTHLLGLHHD